MQAKDIVMKKIWIGFGIALLVILLVKVFTGESGDKTALITRTSKDGRDKTFHKDAAAQEPSLARANLDVLEGNYANKADSIVAFALQRYGVEYNYGGATEEGFDCSGFTTYVYKKFGVDIPHGSSLQAKEGVSVPLKQARKGDLLIFTGTNVEDRTPGHVGIVMTGPEKKIQFVHSSSNGGVKVSEVMGTLYEKRFLDVRRLF
ncbi:hypothetical protein GCM10023183_07430 [Nibribacter koreensis]|uniref:NlpC/P60 domain-containing protein n=2 Tax=Nibribacter koreensis TaxID=1084519 RepID=A0ABP8FA96_9BACT